MALRQMMMLAERRRLPGGDADHPFNQVDAADFFGNTVLHLQPGVYLQEIELPGVGIEDEFHCAGGTVVHRASQARRRRMQRSARGISQSRCRRLLDHLLVAPLDRAVSLAERDDRAISVAEDLHFDMPRVRQVLLEEHAGIAKVVRCQAPHGIECPLQIGRCMTLLHADAAAACSALEHHRVADPLRFSQCRVDVLQQSTAREQWQLIGLCQRTGGVLEPEVAHLRRSRPNEGDARRLAGPGECRIFRKEPVARVDGHRTASRCDLDYPLLVQVTQRHSRRSHAERFIRKANMRRVGVRLGIDRNRSYPHAAQRAQDAASYRAAIGDQHLVEHLN